GELTRIYNLHLESNSISLTSLIKKIKGTYEEFSNEIAHVHEKVKNSNTKRGEQVRDVIEHIENCPYKSIICGDFNDTPMSYSFRKLYQGRKDTFKEAGSGFAATYTTFWPLLRIDYILTPESYNILNHQTRRVKFSDHYPVLAKFSIQ
ncbi:MAG: endonuclease/exonuclease/phosphatase family protein, partial [Bacteroidales bacterium]|nr:endonuclease/exonuclease/phosphatase family protein [Bacteroidales bacterium]